MEKIINGYSVDENLLTGTEFYGEIGTLIDIVRFEDNNVAVIKNEQGQYTYRDTVIDVSVSMTQNGPVVYEQIYMGQKEKTLDDKLIEIINNSLEKSGSLDLLGNGIVNIDLGLQQSANSVFIAEESLLNHLKMCKNRYPELPLNYAIKMLPYEKNSHKTI